MQQQLHKDRSYHHRRCYSNLYLYITETLRRWFSVIVLLLLKFCTEEPEVCGRGDALLRRVHARLHRPLVIIRHAIRRHPEHLNPVSRRYL